LPASRSIVANWAPSCVALRSASSRARLLNSRGVPCKRKFRGHVAPRTRLSSIRLLSLAASNDKKQPAARTWPANAKSLRTAATPKRAPVPARMPVKNAQAAMRIALASPPGSGVSRVRCPERGASAGDRGCVDKFRSCRDRSRGAGFRQACCTS